MSQLKGLISRFTGAGKGVGGKGVGGTAGGRRGRAGGGGMGGPGGLGGTTGGTGSQDEAIGRGVRRLLGRVRR